MIRESTVVFLLNEIILKEPSMRVMKSLLPALFLGTLILSPGSLCADDAAKPVFGPWQKAQVGDYMTVTIPGKFMVSSVDLSEEIRKKIDVMESYVLDNTNSDEYQCLVTNVIYNKGIMGDLDGAAQGAIDNMKGQTGVTNFRVAQKKIQRFNMDGVMLWGDFMADNQKATFQTEIFIKRNIMWMVLIIDSSKQKYDKITQYIFSTININIQ